MLAPLTLNSKHDQPDQMVKTMLAWYDRHHRHLLWRAPPGKLQNPYKVWLSEIMLQQTTVATVGPYYKSFLKRWPNFKVLAAASLDNVLSEWAGLGYYSRARNLHACAKKVVLEHGGKLPSNEHELIKLPGIGPYTAAAITAIALGNKATVVDGNIERVLARLFAVHVPLPKARRKLHTLAAGLTPERRAGDYAQGLMDLGATICTPKQPQCQQCPWARACDACHQGIAETLPRRVKKAAKPTRRGIAFLICRTDGALLLRKRLTQGLLGAMMEVPSTEWHEKLNGDAKNQSPVRANFTPLPGQVRHTFTHFHLELDVWQAEVGNNVKLLKRADPARCQWVKPDQIADQALPTLMRKIIAHAENSN